MNAAVMAAADVIGKVATLAYTILAARILSAEDFGAFSYAVAFSLLVAVIPTWGFDPIVVRDGSADPGVLDQRYRHALTAKLAIALPVFLGTGALAALSRPTARAGITLALVMIAALFDILADSGRAAANAAQRLVGVSAALTINRIASAGLAAGALLAGLGLLGVGAAYLAGSAGGWLISAVAVRRLGLHASPQPSRWREALRLARGSWEVGVAALVSAALFRIDAVLLAALRGDEEVAVYAVAYRLLETVLFVAWAVGRANYPVMSAAAGEPARVRRITETATGVVGILYVPFAAVLLLEGTAVLALLFGAEYAAASTPALRWLAPAPVLFAAAYIGTYGLLALGRARASLYVSVAATSVNILLNLLLIPALGATGAAAATTASYALETVLVVAVMGRHAGVVRFDRGVAVPLLAALPMAGVLLALRAPVLLELVPAGIVYLAAWFALARRLSPDQLRLARRVLRGT